MNGVPCLGTVLLQQELFWKTYRATENQPGRAVANGCSADFSKFKQGCNFFRTLLMLSYSYLPSKGLAVFYKWEGSQAQKAGEVQLSKQPPPSPVRPRPSRLQWQRKQFPLPHRHNAVSNSHMST